jgi:hypothetical protein
VSISATSVLTAPRVRTRDASLLLGFSLPAWVLGFVYFQIACQLFLLVEAVAPFRSLIRSASFGISLVMLAFLPGKTSVQRHPAAGAACAVLGVIILSYLHPGTIPLAGAAQVLMYAAIIGPVFWVTRAGVRSADLHRIVLLIWIFHTASSVAGVIQVLYPGHFQPALSSYTSGLDADYVDSLMITTTSGVRVFRPMGLTDMPGGACFSGFYAVLFGLGFFLASRKLSMKLLSLASMLFGFTCLYLTEVRSVLVMLAICIVALLLLLLWRGERTRLISVGTALLAIVGLSLAWAVALGGDAVTRRIASLTAGDPQDVYYQSRGTFLDYTIHELLPTYPLGAGLGHWGMVNVYFGDRQEVGQGQLFGDRSDPRRGPIWVEIQWTGWLLDGGIPLIIAYVLALATLFRGAWNIALTHRGGMLWIWGGVVLAYNLGAFAATFNYPFFLSQSGLELWLLNAALFSAAQPELSSRSHLLPYSPGRR